MREIVKIWFDSRDFQKIKSISELCQYVSELNTILNIKKEFLCSDVFPFRGDDYYIIKPVAITNGLLNLSIKNHKYHRTLQYINIYELDKFFWGGFDYKKNSQIAFGKIVYDKASGVSYELAEEVGFYFFVDLKNKKDRVKLDSLIEKIDISEIKCIQREMLPDIKNDLSSELHIFIGLCDINTCELSPEQLEYLIDKSYFQIAYSEKKSNVKIKSGMCIEGEVEPWLCKNIYMLKI